jgi:hypothetical protein
VRPKPSAIVLVSLALAAGGIWYATRPRHAAPGPRHAVPAAWDALEETPVEARLLCARVFARQAVLRDLLAGRMTIPEAAAVFDWLDRQPPVPTISVTEAVCWSAVRSPVEIELAAGARVDGEWQCLRVTGWARDLAAMESPDRAAEFSVALDAGLLRVWESGKARALPAVDEAGCRALHDRALAVASLGATGSTPPVATSGLRLIDRKSE